MPGYIIGCTELIEYTLYISVSNYSLACLICYIFELKDDFVYLFCFLFYVTAIYVYSKAKPIFWNFNYIIGSISAIILAIYILGSLKYVDFNKYANPIINDLPIDNKISNFMRIFPLASWFYVGIEALSFSCDSVQNPRINVSYGSIICLIILICFSVCVLFVTASLPSENLHSVSQLAYPLNNGFKLMFGVKDEHSKYLGILSIPAVYATAFGFINPQEKLLLALSQSRLLPEFLSNTYGKYNIPYNSLIFGSVVGYIICIVIHNSSFDGQQIYLMCILSAFITYMR